MTADIILKVLVILEDIAAVMVLYHAVKCYRDIR